MKKILAIFVAFITIFMTMSSPVFANINLEEKNIESENVIERALADLNIGIGDFLVKFVNKLVGEEVTINKIVFNQIDALNPNFFDKSIVDKVSATSIVRGIVSEWYNFFMMLAIAGYIVALLIIGIKILMNDIASALAKAKEILTKWLVGVMILFCFPYVMKLIFNLNEIIVRMIYNDYVGTHETVTDTSGAEEWSVDEIEFRSPAYVSRFTGRTGLTTEEYTEMHLAKLNTYKAKLDMTKIMRAYAGATKKLIYVIIWMVLFWQSVVLLVKYYKRYFIIALLIVIFPLICLYYIIDIAKGKNGQVFSTWIKELTVNIMIQSIHAIIYAIIASIVIQRITEDIVTRVDSMNWILMIVSINFLSQGEKIVRKILGADASTVAGIGNTSKAMRGRINKATGTVKRLMPRGKK